MTRSEHHPTPEPGTANDVICPCCAGQFSGFLPYGLTARPNAKCPRCGSKKRHRLLWLFLRDRTNFFTARLRVLHFAPERCLRQAFAELPNLDYVTADLMREKVTLAIDITAIPPSAGTFDAILCSHVLEHVTDDRQGMRELCRVLNPGGWAVIMVPLERNRPTTLEDPSIVSPTERERVFGQHDHVRLYGQDVQQRLESAGFSVAVHRAKDLGMEAVRKHALSSNDQIYYCTKPD